MLRDGPELEPQVAEYREQPREPRRAGRPVRGRGQPQQRPHRDEGRRPAAGEDGPEGRGENCGRHLQKSQVSIFQTILSNL